MSLTQQKFSESIWSVFNLCWYLTQKIIAVPENVEWKPAKLVPLKSCILESLNLVRDGHYNKALIELIVILILEFPNEILSVLVKSFNWY